MNKLFLIIALLLPMVCGAQVLKVDTLEIDGKRFEIKYELVLMVDTTFIENNCDSFPVPSAPMPWWDEEGTIDTLFWINPETMNDSIEVLDSDIIPDWPKQYYDIDATDSIATPAFNPNPDWEGR